MSAAISKGYAQTRAGQIHYRIARAATDLAPVIFIHRAPMSGATFQPVFDRLADWRTLIAFDVPGFGQSCPAPEGATLRDVASLLIEAMEQLEITEAHLVGHHSGGAIAAEMAAMLGSRIRSIMLDGAMIADTDARRSSVPPALAPEITREGEYLSAAWGFLQPYYTVFEPRLVHEGLVGALQSLFTRGPTMAAVRDHDLRATLLQVTCPVLASAAEDDVHAAHLERVQAIRPDAAIHRIGRAGIASPELQADAFADLVRRAVALGERGT